jgi:hypothetical protein
MRKALGYGAALIALYLGVVYFEGASSDISAGGKGVKSIVAAFQGRNA